MIYLLSLGAGILAALSPCVLPILPIMAGSSTSKHRLGPLFISFGLIVSFALVGTLFGALTTVFGITEETLRSASAWLLLAIGAVVIIPHLRASVSSKFTKLSSYVSTTSHSLDNRGLWGQFGIGALLGAAWSPCVGPTLGLALGLAGTNGGASQAVAMMVIFAFGLSLPLLSVAYGFRSLLVRRKTDLIRLNRIGTQVLGVSVILVGALILSGGDKYLEALIASSLPDWFLSLSSIL